MLTSEKKLFEQARVRVVGLRAAEVFVPWKKTSILTD